jgi:hypothetical protein
VIRTRKSIPNKESEHGVELKSIEVTSMKMLEIRFASILNCIQMRQNRVSSIRGKGALEEWESRQQTNPALNRNHAIHAIFRRSIA